MTVVVSQKQRIFYRFEGDKGAYLLLHHGLLGSHQDWYDAGYVDALRDEFRLIVMDARGHGRSDRPLEPEKYSLAAMVDDVIAVMDELDIRNLHFFGYSLGALVGFEFLMRHPERVRIVMLGGESPFLSPEVQNQWRELADDIGREGLSAVRQRLLERHELVGKPPAEMEGEALAAQALLRALAEEAPRPDEGRISVDSPVALFTGEEDPGLDRMRDARRRIHRARFVSVPGRTRAGLFTERDTLVSEIVRLLRPGRRDGAQGDEGGSRQSRGDRGPRQGQGQGRGRGRSRNGANEAPAERRPNGESTAQQGERSNGGQRTQSPLTPPPPVDVPEREPRTPESARAEPPPQAPSETPAPAPPDEASKDERESAGNAATDEARDEQAPTAESPETPPQRREDESGERD